MKRFSNILIICLLFVALIACGKRSESKVPTKGHSVTILSKTKTSSISTSSINNTSSSKTSSNTKSTSTSSSKASSTSKTSKSTSSSSKTSKSTAKSTTITSKSTTITSKSTTITSKSTTITSKSTTKSTQTVKPTSTVKKYNVVFMDGEVLVQTIQVNEGASLTEMPNIPLEDGYDKVWDVESITNVHENITVHSVKTAKAYTITLQFADDELSSFPLESYIINVTYGEEFTLPTPISTNLDRYEFEGWLYNGEAFVSGVYNIPSSIIIIADVTHYTIQY